MHGVEREINVWYLKGRMRLFGSFFVEHVLSNECVKILVLAIDRYLHRLIVKYSKILYPINAEERQTEIPSSKAG